MTTRTFTLTLTLPFICPQCHEPCGYLYEQEGICLGCMLDNEDRDEHESREADEFWGAAEMSAATCGVD